MPLAPALDVIPVELSTLYADDAAHILTILCAASPQFPDDNVLSGREKYLPMPHRYRLTAAESFLVVWIRRKQEDLDLEHRARHTKLLPLSARIRFEG